MPCHSRAAPATDDQKRNPIRTNTSPQTKTLSTMHFKITLLALAVAATTHAAQASAAYHEVEASKIFLPGGGVIDIRVPGGVRVLSTEEEASKIILPGGGVIAIRFPGGTQVYGL
ncbi:hypothetical protein EC968_004621 [Mortierella alpina]|nr:hypothetical protein EC968_004621 [Mortierella alpina]